MSEDRLELIKCRNNDYCLTLTEAISQADVDWLISELEQCRTEYNGMAVSRDNLQDRAEKAEAENKELNALFELQHTTTQKAEYLWQKAFNKPNIMPDLGELIRWLMAEAQELREFNSECEDRFRLMESDRDYSQSERLRQKRHRKYAVKKIIELLREGRFVDKEADRYYKMTEKLKAEIGRLKIILANKGILY